MLLVQKNTTIELPDSHRVKKLICISFSVVLVVRNHDIIVYDISSNSKISIFNLADLDDKIITKNTGREVGILSAAYHPILNCILLLVSQSGQRHKNWTLVSIALHPPSILFQNTKPVLLSCFEENKSKYEQMQLQPRIIVFPKSNMFIFLRQFYNESMVTLFRDGQEEGSFFLNQENMAEFDQKQQVVTYRDVFFNKLDFQIYKVGLGQKKGHKYSLSNQQKGGTILAIKKLNSYTIQNREQLHHNSLICINKQSKQIAYIIYNSQTQQQIKNIGQTQSNTLMLDFFCLKGNKICSLQLHDKKQYIVFEDYLQISNQQFLKIDKQVDKNMEKRMKEVNLLDVGGMINQMDVFKFGTDFVVVNYLQSFDQENKVQCRFWRNYDRKQALFGLALKKEIPECLLESMMRMLEQSK